MSAQLSLGLLYVGAVFHIIRFDRHFSINSLQNSMRIVGLWREKDKEEEDLWR